jgi:hypothetical protein
MLAIYENIVNELSMLRREAIFNGDYSQAEEIKAQINSINNIIRRMD